MSFVGWLTDRWNQFRRKQGATLGEERGIDQGELSDRSFGEAERNALKNHQEELRDTGGGGAACPDPNCGAEIHDVGDGVSNTSGQTDSEAHKYGDPSGSTGTEYSTQQSQSIEGSIKREVLSCKNPDCDYHLSRPEAKAARNIHSREKDRDLVGRFGDAPSDELKPDRAMNSTTAGLRETSAQQPNQNELRADEASHSSTPENPSSGEDVVSSPEGVSGQEHTPSESNRDKISDLGSGAAGASDNVSETTAQADTPTESDRDKISDLGSSDAGSSDKLSETDAEAGTSTENDREEIAELGGGDASDSAEQSEEVTKDVDKQGEHGGPSV